MHAYGGATHSERHESCSGPSDELRVAITFPKADGSEGPTKFPAPLSTATVKRFIPDPLQVDRALYELSRRGFTLTSRGRLTASMRVTKARYEQVFGTRLSSMTLNDKHDYAFHSLYFPAQNAPWHPDPQMEHLIDDAYIQWPHIYMSPKMAVTPSRRARTGNGRNGGRPSVHPPDVDYFHLSVPKDVASYLHATEVHKAGTTGKGVRVAMIDSGFAHRAHPFFKANKYKSTVDLAPRATNDKTDVNGHGTGESANIFAIAPDATFIGVKVDNDEDPRLGATILEGFQQALTHHPQIISISLGYDLRDENSFRQLDELPNSLAALEAEIQAAVAAGIIVVFSAGNGHFSFPGMMPDVISAGGVFVDEQGGMQASDYASAFLSKIYSGRSVPDFCGLVGMQPHASYIMLPIPRLCEIDRETSEPEDGNGDETARDDGWGVFSGTSAAAPQLAAVCALLLEKNSSLTPTDLKAVLRRTAQDVSVGSGNPASSDTGVGVAAGPGDDGATGAGLVDAFAAWQEV
jgi:subtilisin family serine protease